MVPPCDLKAVREFVQCLLKHFPAIVCLCGISYSPKKKVSSVEHLWILAGTAVAQTSSLFKDCFGFFHDHERAVAIQRDEFLMSYMFLSVPEKSSVQLPASCAAITR